MKKLDESQLRRLANSVPLIETFQSPAYQTEDEIVEKEILRFAEKVKSLNWLSVKVLTHSYSSYVPIFVSSDHSEAGSVKGFMMLFSKLIPCVVISKGVILYGSTGLSYSLPDISEVERGNQLTCSVSSTLKDALQITCYHLCEPYELDVSLPEGVGPVDWGLGERPWNKLFHIIFQDTD